MFPLAKVSTIKDFLHWRNWQAVLTYLGHVGRCDTDRSVSIYFAMLRVAKASKYWLLCVAVVSVIVLTFANGNTASRQWQWHVTVLALANLSGTTKNRNDRISFTPPKVAKVCSIVIVTCHSHWQFRLKNFANALEQYKIIYYIGLGNINKTTKKPNQLKSFIGQSIFLWNSGRYSQTILRKSCDHIFLLGFLMYERSQHLKLNFRRNFVFHKYDRKYFVRWFANFVLVFFLFFNFKWNIKIKDCFGFRQDASLE